MIDPDPIERMAFTFSFAIAVFATLFLNNSYRKILDRKTVEHSKFETIGHIVWLVGFPIMAFCSAHHVVNQTWVVSRRGPWIPDIIQGLDSPLAIIPMFGIAVSVAYLALALVDVTLVRRVWKNARAFRWSPFVATLIALATFAIPTRSLNHVALYTLWNGDNAGRWLSYSAGYGDLTSVEMLVKRGVSLDTPDEYGTTALIGAAGGDQFAIAKYLLAHGANVNASRHDKGTALRVALEDNHNEIAQLLFANGATLPCEYDEARRIREALASHATSDSAVSHRPDAIRVARLMHKDTLLAGWAAARGEVLISCDN